MRCNIHAVTAGLVETAIIDSNLCRAANTTVVNADSTTTVKVNIAERQLAAEIAGQRNAMKVMHARFAISLDGNGLCNVVVAASDGLIRVLVTPERIYGGLPRHSDDAALLDQRHGLFQVLHRACLCSRSVCIVTSAGVDIHNIQQPSCLAAFGAFFL